MPRTKKHHTPDSFLDYLRKEFELVSAKMSELDVSSPEYSECHLILYMIHNAHLAAFNHRRDHGKLIDRLKRIDLGK